MTNHLRASTSPYLLQHAENPVDWWEWGKEAFAEARRREVPILLSVGYAACHWCHVMAHESFEDVGTAEIMNAGFVCIKVDREERPDVDAVYMAATQAMSGQGGWPMTVFATPEGEPFYAGTYYPPRPVYGRPSFRQVLAAVSEAWEQRREEVRASASALSRHLRPAASVDLPVAAGGPDASAPEEALRRVGGEFDRRHGGFGGAPKFPPSMLLEWLLRHHARTGDAAALEMAGATFDAMARGGIYDQLGGGFARYSVDAEWVVPHFEKMLYDNALLLRGYAHLWRLTRSDLARRVCEETAAWLLRELTTKEGGLASSLDADSPDAAGHSREGAYYVWTPAELREALGDDDAEWAAGILSVTEEGSFEHGASVLQLRSDVAPHERARYEDVRQRLFEVRARRAAPARDDKVVAAWNGLAIAGLADAGAILEHEEWVSAAARAADLLLTVHIVTEDGTRRLVEEHPASAPDPAGSRLRRTSRDGTAGSSLGMLEDYADVAEGLLALYGATGSERYVTAAGALLRTVLDRFRSGTGVFYDTADDETDPVLAHLGRPQERGDGPTPSGPAAAAGALLSYAALTGSLEHREAAEQALAGLLPFAPHAPRAVGWALAVTEAALDGPREVAIVGPLDDERTVALHRAAVRAGAPGVVVGLADPTGTPEPRVPLLTDRPLVGGAPAAYVCRQLACERPTTDPDQLARSLAAR